MLNSQARLIPSLGIVAAALLVAGAWHASVPLAEPTAPSSAAALDAAGDGGGPVQPMGPGAQAVLGRAETPFAGRSTPIVFEENLGQADAAHRFVARAGNGIFAFGADRVDVRRIVGPASLALDAEPQALDDVTLLLPAAAEPVGEGATGGISSYFSGSPEDWVSGARHFESIRYPSILAGVDLVFHARKGAVEFDLEVAPGADPSAFALRSQPAALELLPDGTLAAGFLTMAAPVLYQDGPAGREAVAGWFTVESGAARFWVGPYDASRTLVIDPTLGFSTYLGGNSADYGTEIAADTSGVYVFGSTLSSNMPIVTPSFGAIYKGSYDMFLAKYKPDGSAIVYSAYIGAPSSNDYASAIDLRPDGSVFIVGACSRPGCPGTAGTLKPTFSTFNGYYDVWIGHVNPAGNALIKATHAGQPYYDFPTDIAIAPDGTVYIVGETQTFSSSAAYFTYWNKNGNLVNAGSTCCTPMQGFMARLKADLTGPFLYATYIRDGQGGCCSAYYTGILAVELAPSSSTVAFVGGRVSADWATYEKLAWDSTYNGGSTDGLLQKYDTSLLGSASLLTGTYLGGTGNDIVWDIEATANDLVVYGQTSSCSAYYPGAPAACSTTCAASCFPATPTSADPYLNDGYTTGVYDVFVGRVPFSLAAPTAMTYLGGSSNEYPMGQTPTLSSFDVFNGDSMVLDSEGNVNVVGKTFSSPAATAPFQIFPSGSANKVDPNWENTGFAEGFVATLAGDLSFVQFASYLGGGSDDGVHAVAADPYLNLYVTGQTDSKSPTAFPLRMPLQGTASPSTEAFVTCIGGPYLSTAKFDWAQSTLGTRPPYHPNAVHPGMLLSFFDQSFPNTPLAIVDWEWDMGNGVILEGPTPSYFYPATDLGPKTVKLTIRNATCGVSSYTLDLDVVENVCPAPPTLTADLLEAMAGDPVGFAAPSSDTDGVIAQTFFDFDDGGAAVASPATHAFANMGYYLVSAYVVDDDGCRMDAGVVQVRANQAVSSVVFGEYVAPPPVAEAGPDQTVRSGQRVRLDGTASSLQATQFRWEHSAGPTALVDDPASPTPSFIAPEVGAEPQDVQFTLRVYDGHRDSLPDSVTVRVLPDNRRPTAVLATPTLVRSGVLVEMDASGSTDPDDDGLAYTWRQLDGTRVDLVADGPRASFTAPGVGTELLLSVTVSDGSMASPPAIARVTVKPVPMTDIVFAKERREGSTVVRFEPLIPEDGLTYQWELGDGTTAENATVEHAYTDSGEYTVRLRVTDGAGYEDEASRTLRVQVTPAGTVSSVQERPDVDSTAWYGHQALWWAVLGVLMLPSLGVLAWRLARKPQ